MGVDVLGIAKESPALRRRKQGYWLADRFGDRVPLRVRMVATVKPDPVPVIGVLPGHQGMICPDGELFYVWVNSYGAVAAIHDDGRKLGLRPDEFEVVEFHPSSTVPEVMKGEL